MDQLVLGVVADDLSGAAECASHAALRVSRSLVVLAPAGADPSPATADAAGAAQCLAVDTDSRALGAAAAGAL